MKPHAFYKGLLRDMCMWDQEPTVQALCAYPDCGEPFTPTALGEEYCSTRCAEDHDTVLKGGTPLPEYERCTCSGDPNYSGRWHAPLCPKYVPHPEDYTHPLENET